MSNRLSERNSFEKENVDYNIFCNVSLTKIVLILVSITFHYCK